MNRGKNSNKTSNLQIGRLLKQQAVRSLGPGQIQSNIPIRYTFRFTANANANYIPLTDAGLCGVTGVFCQATNSSCYSLAGGFKLHKISVWSPFDSTIGTAYCSVGWVSSNPGTGANLVKEDQDTSLSSAYPAHVSARPPSGSLASFMRNSSTSPVCYITCLKGATIDIEATLWLSDGGAASQGWTVSTCTAGYIYYLALDDVPAGGGTQYFLPLGRTTTS